MFLQHITGFFYIKYKMSLLTTEYFLYHFIIISGALTKHSKTLLATSLKEKKNIARSKGYSVIE